MDQVNKLLEQAAYVLLFCLGLSLLLLGYGNLNKTMNLLKVTTAREDILRQQEVKEESSAGTMFTVTKGELVGYLTGAVETDFIIDGVSYDRDTFERESFDYSILPEGIYSKEYKFEDDGLLTEIVYKHLN